MDRFPELGMEPVNPLQALPEQFFIGIDGRMTVTVIGSPAPRKLLHQWNSQRRLQLHGMYDGMA